MTARIGSERYRRLKAPLAAICARCPVTAECLTNALSYPDDEDGYGIRAGTDRIERARMREEQ